MSSSVYDRVSEEGEEAPIWLGEEGWSVPIMEIIQAGRFGFDRDTDRDVLAALREMEEEDDMTITNREGETLLHTLILKGFSASVEYLLKERLDKSALEIETNYGYAAVHILADFFTPDGSFGEDGLWGVFRVLVGAGVVVDFGLYNRFGDTFLHIVLDQRPVQPEELHRVLETLPREDLRRLVEMPGGSMNNSPLHYAVLSMEVEERSLQLLKSVGVDFNLRNDQDDSILYNAIVGKRSVGFLKRLVEECGADVHQLGYLGTSVLHTAAEKGSFEALKFLVEGGFGLDVNCTDDFGNSPVCRVVYDIEEGRGFDKRDLLVRHGAVGGSRSLGLLGEE